MTDPTSILAFRNGSIGNTLVAVPALRALKRRYPRARLSVVVDPVGYELLEYCPWIDHLIVYDRRDRHGSLRGYLSLVGELRRQAPSHAVLFKRFLRNGLLAFLSGAAVRAGFSTEGKAHFLNLTIPYDETINIVDLNLKLAACMGAPSADRSLELHLTEADRSQGASLVEQRIGRGTPYVVAYYGGQTVPPESLLPVGVFARMLRSLTENRISVVLTGAGRHEKELATDILNALPHPVILMDLPIRVSAAIIKGASLMIGMNSGPTHIAAAVGTPLLVLIRPDTPTFSEQRKWLPVGNNVFPFQIPPDAQFDGWEWRAHESYERAHELLRQLTPAAI